MVRREGRMYPPMAENKAFLVTRGQLATMGVREAGLLHEEMVYYIKLTNTLGYQVMSSGYENVRGQRAAQKWWIGLGAAKMRVVSEKGPRGSAKTHERQNKDGRNWDLRQKRAADRCKRVALLSVAWKAWKSHMAAVKEGKGTKRELQERGERTQGAGKKGKMVEGSQEKDWDIV